MGPRQLRNLQRRIPDTLLRYSLPIATVAVLTGLTYLERYWFGPNNRVANIIVIALAALVSFGAAWLGYVPGLLTNVLIVYVSARLLIPRPITPRRSSREALYFIVATIVGLAISRISQNVRKREAALMHTAEDLEASLRERADEAVRSAEAMQEAMKNMREQTRLLDLAHDAIFSLDPGGNILFWNRGAEQMYGWTREEAMGKNVHELLQTEFSIPLVEIQQHIHSKGHWEGELNHKRKDGRILRVASRWASSATPGGKESGFLEINTDITERHRMEEKLQHTAKLESLGILAGGVAHDFNNLLTGILGNASLALSSFSPHHPDRILIEEVVKAAERASDLTRQLLAYAGKGRFVMRTVNLSDLVREISGLVQTSVPKNAQLRLQLQDDLPGIDADPGQVQQIIMNLVINGAEAIGPEGGTVLVQTGTQDVDEQYIATFSPADETLQPGRYVSLQVHDTGAGMSEETQRKMFDPFFSTKFAGRGLGLSAVLGIVQSHRGALKVYSEPGRGTTFRVIFPVSRYPVQPRHVPDVEPLRGIGTVLVVDDEAIVRDAARITLERYGYETLAAPDGMTAVEEYRKHREKIDLVLLDLTMPLMSGEETLQQIRFINPEVRVLLTSGYNEAEAVQRFSGKGLAGFIQKPYTADALARKVREVLADRGRSHAHT